MASAVQRATLEALVAGHPAGRAAALLQQRASKVKGKEGMALRLRITALEDQAAGREQGCDQSLHPESVVLNLIDALPMLRCACEHV